MFLVKNIFRGWGSPSILPPKILFQDLSETFSLTLFSNYFWDLEKFGSFDIEYEAKSTRVLNIESQV